MTANTHGVWKAPDCALVLSDYQDHILDTVWQLKNAPTIHKPRGMTELVAGWQVVR